MQNEINDDGCDPSGDDVDDVMSPEVDGGDVDEQQEHQRQDEERFVARLPGQYRQDDGDAYMTAGEGGRGALTSFVGGLQQLVEESVRITRDGQFVLMEGEVSADVREHTIGDIIESYHRIIVLRSRDGQEHKDHIVNEERGENHKGGTLELLITAEEVEEADDGYQWEIAGIADDQRLADEDAGQSIIEQQGWLTVEDLLFPRGKDVVEVGEDAVDFVGVWIPPRQQGQMQAHPAEDGKSAGHHLVDHPQGSHRHQDTEAPPEHRLGVDGLCIGE